MFRKDYILSTFVGVFVGTLLALWLVPKLIVVGMIGGGALG